MPYAYRGEISLESEVDDWIGQGKSAKFSLAEGAAFSTEVLPHLEPIKNAVEFDVEFGGKYWRFRFSAPKESRLKAGNYVGTRRFNDEITPGLDVTTTGRGSNQCFGQFTVKKIKLTKTGELFMFQAEFEQHSEQPSAPALRGTIYYCRGRNAKA